MKSKILHIAKDEKFIDSAIKQFESLKTIRSDFYIFNQNSQFKYIKLHDKVNFFNSITSINDILNQYDIIIFHSLDVDFFPIILNTKKQHTCIWMCFGYEIYNDSFYFNKKNLYGILTRNITNFKTVSLKKKLKNYLRPFKRIIFKNLVYTNQEVKINAIRRMDYIVSSYSEEFFKISKLIHQRKKQLTFTYYPLEYLVDINDSSIIRENQILVGNSGTLTNNHLDVFKKLQVVNIGNYNILCPLSYGDSSYIEKIISIGQEKFGDNFLPLTEFLPLDNYNEIIKKSSIAIFYNFRQQGLGNVIAALWYGAKVYLSRKNTLYVFLKRMNIIIYNFDDDICFKKILTINEIEQNRQILKALFNEKKLIENLNLEIQKLCNRN